MPDMEDPHEIAFNRKEDSVDVRLAAVQKLAHLNGRLSILGSHGTTQGKGRQRGNRLSEGYEPALTGVSRLL
jgi:hypothetical protein